MDSIIEFKLDSISEKTKRRKREEKQEMRNNRQFEMIDDIAPFNIKITDMFLCDCNTSFRIDSKAKLDLFYDVVTRISAGNCHPENYSSVIHRSRDR